MCKKIKNWSEANGKKYVNKMNKIKKIADKVKREKEKERKKKKL